MPKPAQTGLDTEAASSLYARLYAQSGASAYGMSAGDFAAILDEIAAKYQSQSPAQTPRSFATASFSEAAKDGTPTKSVSAADAAHAGFWSTLRLEELALARACAFGNERAWHDFIDRYRQKLHSMAMHITRDAAHAADLADSLFADLYGLNTREGARNSKLRFYTGRGSIEGWLRTVMAQEFINRYRKQKRTVSLEEQTEAGVQFAAPSTKPLGGFGAGSKHSNHVSEHISDRRVEGQLEAATDEALAELSAEDRFTLAAYFLDNRTLAEIARTLGLHESSVSRRLDRLTTGLRKRILAGLKTLGMSHAQAGEALDADVRDLRLNLRARLTQDSTVRTFPESKVPAAEVSGINPSRVDPADERFGGRKKR